MAKGPNDKKIVYTCPMHPQVKKDKPGRCPICGMDLVPLKGKKKPPVKMAKMEHASHPEQAKNDAHSACPECGSSYTCPMHPEVKKNKPGMCPICGMNLVPEKKAKGPEVEHVQNVGHSISAFARMFWINFILTIPVIIYSSLPMSLFGWMAPEFPGSFYLSPLLSIIIFFYGGKVFLQGAYYEIKGRMPGMMTLIAIAITVSFFYSMYSLAAGMHETMFWELTTLITVMLLGHLIEMKSVQGAHGALKEMSKLLPDMAEVMKGGRMKKVTLAQLKRGDIVLVRPGGKVPADGVIIEGNSEINESMITGESKPVMKLVKNEVIAGTINGDGPLKIRVTKIGEKTFLAGVMRLVDDAQSSKSRLQLLSDEAALYLTIVAISAGALTFIYWILAKAGPLFALERLVAVLVITCPHALGLAIPIVAMISTSLAANNGLLVRDRPALENARKIDTVLFDKTGTLTLGEFGIERVVTVGNMEENEVLRLAASVDAGSEHFIAKAIVKEAAKRKLKLIRARSFKRIAGMGVKGNVAGKIVLVGGSSLLKLNRISIPSGMRKALNDEREKGRTIIYIAKARNVVGAISLGDTVRQESMEALKKLKEMGIKVAMITGDNEEAAKRVAGELGIDEYFANVLPDKKSGKVKLLQERGAAVAMVGDGINDAPALTQADLGIAIGAGTNVAIESAGIILVKNDPRDIVKIIRLSRATYSKMLQNLFWATIYNLLAMPAAAGVLSAWGVMLQPAFSAVLMSFSTIIVVFNALFLRRAKLY